MTNKEALYIVMKIANRHADDYEQEEEILAALSQMEDYYNDMEDDLIITQGDKKLKEMLED